MTNEELYIREIPQSGLLNQSFKDSFLKTLDRFPFNDAPLNIPQEDALDIYKRIKEQGSSIITAISNGEVRSTATIFYLNNIDGSKAAYIEDVATHIDHEGQKLSGKVMNKATDNAREKGVDSISLDCEEDLIKFYSTFDFQTIPGRQMAMYLDDHTLQSPTNPNGYKIQELTQENMRQIYDVIKTPSQNWYDTRNLINKQREEGHIHLLAYRDEVLQGYTSLFLEQKFLRNGKIAAHLFPQHKVNDNADGIEGILIHGAIRTAKKHNAYKIITSASPEENPLYGALGFQTKDYTMKLDLIK
ncbi:MAG: putative GNAT family N-acyltransferase [Patescibacteria group bacterium]|jgi:predicted GNAT family N-acyltransferase